MPRALNLRQIELFKAFMEHGTVSRAAEVLAISQPAASKLLMHLEADHGLKLFDRGKGRLTPTAQAMRLYEEVGRIFAGVRQVETAIAAIRREPVGMRTPGRGHATVVEDRNDCYLPCGRTGRPHSQSSSHLADYRRAF